MTGQRPVPGRRVEPLAPPPGSFDRVLGQAQARRYRRLWAVTGVMGVFLTGIWGGLALGGGMSGVQTALVRFTDSDPAPVATRTPSGDPTTTAAGQVPGTGRSPSRGGTAPALPTAITPTAATAAPAAPGGNTLRAKVRGRVLDGSGDPVAGMYVYTGSVEGGSFVPSSAPSAVTGRHGGYAVPCTGGPVLLTPWLLNQPLGSIAEARSGAHYLSSPRCSRDARAAVTEVSAGATVSGHVSTDAGCADADLPLWVWIGSDRTTTVRLSGLREGGAFRVSGLPAGTHVLGARGRRTAVTVGPRTSITQDVVFACPDPPTPTSSPTTTPDPTPSETTTTDPSATGSPTPQPWVSTSSPPPSGGS